MKTHLAFGRNGLEVRLDDRWNVQVVEPKYVPGAPGPEDCLRQALRRPIGSAPLAQRVQASDRVGIIFNDITRATPNELMLPVILAELAHVPAGQITLYNALGTHRPNTEAELRRMLGDDLVDRYRIVQNDAFDRSTQVCLGKTSRGNEIWLNADLMACDVKLLTGFIEPHFFAGFSGGGKAVMPGMAGQSTVLGNHNAAKIADARATWGVTRGNPLWEEVREVALQAGELFLVNVTLNRDKHITTVFAGDLDQAHAAGCEYVREKTMVAVDEPFDIVLTSNSGYPLDLNLYQAVKGMSAAAQVVKPGGAIVIAAECWDGIPEHGLFGQLLAEASSVEDLLATIRQPGFSKQDQWQAQVLGQILQKAEVYVHSTHLSAEQIRKAMLQPAESVEETIAGLVSRYGSKTQICVLPEGPVTIPYVKA
jgi:lactate racemase